MMQMILVAMSLVAIVMMGCGSSATTSESESNTTPEQPEESGPALLLSEESAISILRAYLQECVLSWAGPNRFSTYNRANPLSEQEKEGLRDLLIDLATGENGDFEWAASYHGITEVSNAANRMAETWVVIGPGLETAGSPIVVPGRWKVYAGHRSAYYLDASARLALAEYTRFSTCRS